MRTSESFLRRENIKLESKKLKRLNRLYIFFGSLPVIGLILVYIFYAVFDTISHPVFFMFLGFMPTGIFGIMVIATMIGNERQKIKLELEVKKSFACPCCSKSIHTIQNGYGVIKEVIT